MADAHFDQMTYLMGFIFILMLVIVGTIVLSQISKRKKPSKELTKSSVIDSQLETRAHKQKSEIEIGLPFQNVKTIDVPVPIVVTEEKEITIAEALAKTEESFFGRIRKAFSNHDKIKVIEEIEEILYTSDLGPQTVEKLLEAIKTELSSKELTDVSAIKKALHIEMTEILKPVQSAFENHIQLQQQISQSKFGPTVIMIVGVNGAGKTTSIGKITSQLAIDGKKILVAAGDTFRAAAGNQLKTWTDRAQASTQANSDSTGAVEIYWPTNTTDPSAVAFDAVQKGKAEKFDYVILDTAGRLHTQVGLMDELKKVKRVMTKVIPEAPHETWIVLDANSGQNALVQAREFHQALSLSGVILTKMDGTAKGGVALALVDQLQIPIKLIGVGEKVSDLRLFKHSEYIESILGI